MIIRHKDINKSDCLRQNNTKSRHKKITRSCMLSENLEDFDVSCRKRSEPPEPFKVSVEEEQHFVFFPLGKFI